MKINLNLDKVDLLDVIVFGLEAKYGIKKVSHQNIEIHLDKEEGYTATIKNVMLGDLK